MADPSIWNFMVYLWTSFGTILIVAGFFWGGDDLISDEGSELISSAISYRIDNPKEILKNPETNLMDKFFSRNVPTMKFVRNVALVSIVSISILLFIYIYTVKGLAAQLITEKFALYYFSRQIIFDGLPTVFIVNFISFNIYAGRTTEGREVSFASLVIDIVVKLITFLICTVFIYIFFTIFLHSDNNNITLALHSIGITLREAIFFHNLTSVYLYSVAISSLPIFMMFLIYYMANHPMFASAVHTAFFWLPFKKKPIRALSIVVGFFLAIFAGCAAVAASIAMKIL